MRRGRALTAALAIAYDAGAVAATAFADAILVPQPAGAPPVPATLPTLLAGALKVRAAVQCFIVPALIALQWEMAYEVHKRRSANFCAGCIRFDQGHRTAGAVGVVARLGMWLLAAVLLLFSILINAPLMAAPADMVLTTRFTSGRLGLDNLAPAGDNGSNNDIPFDWHDGLDFVAMALLLALSAANGASLWLYGTTISTDVRATSVNPWASILLTTAGLGLAWGFSPATWVVPYAVEGMLVALLVAVVVVLRLVGDNMRTLEEWDATLAAVNDAVVATMAANAKLRELAAAHAAHRRRAASVDGALLRADSAISMLSVATGGARHPTVGSVGGDDGGRHGGGGSGRRDSMADETASVTEVEGGSMASGRAGTGPHRDSMDDDSVVADDHAASRYGASGGAVHVSVSAPAPAAPGTPASAGAAVPPTLPPLLPPPRPAAVAAAGDSGSSEGVHDERSRRPSSASFGLVTDDDDDDDVGGGGGGRPASETGSYGHERGVHDGGAGSGRDTGRHPRAASDVLVAPGVVAAVHAAVLAADGPPAKLVPPTLAATPSRAGIGASSGASGAVPPLPGVGTLPGSPAGRAGTPRRVPSGEIASGGGAMQSSPLTTRHPALHHLALSDGPPGSPTASTGGATPGGGSNPATSSLGRLANLVGLGIGTLAAGWNLRCVICLLTSSRSHTPRTPAAARHHPKAETTPAHWLFQEAQWRAQMEKHRDATAASPHPPAAGGALPPAGDVTAGGEPSSGEASSSLRGAAVPLWSRTFAEADLEGRIRAAAAAAAAAAAEPGGTAAPASPGTAAASQPAPPVLLRGAGGKSLSPSPPVVGAPPAAPSPHLPSLLSGYRSSAAVAGVRR